MGVFEGAGKIRVHDGGGLEVSTDGGNTWATAGGSGGFGSDTLVPLPNASSQNVTALELVTTLPTATAGSEMSQWDMKTLNAGAPVTPLSLRGTQVLGAVGTGAAPSFAFNGSATARGCGMYLNALTTPNLIFAMGGVPQFQITWAGQAVNAGPFLVGTDLLRGMTQIGLANLKLYSNGDVVIGNDNALAQATTVGFLQLPTCAGAPSGTPADLRPGKVAMIYDTTNSKLWAWNGTAWKGVVLA